MAAYKASNPIAEAPVAPQGLDPEVLAQAFVMAQQMQEKLKADARVRLPDASRPYRKPVSRSLRRSAERWR
jgi:hypothetical protein